MNSRDKAAALQHWLDSPVHVTEAGLDQMQRKLRRLKEKLPGLIDEAARTAAYGDRSDNAEYKDAKQILRRTERQILTIEDQLKRVKVITPGPSPTGKVRIGSTVVVEAEDGTRKTLQILGSQESDPGKGRISYISPFGAALMDRGILDSITLQVAGGTRKYRILDIY